MMNMDLDETDSTLFRLQDFQTALALALRTLAIFGAHWTDPKCNYLKSPVSRCSCGLIEARRELSAAVKQANR